MEYRVIRSDRKTTALHITPQGEVIVRCPRRMPRQTIQALVESKAAWIATHLARLKSLPSAPVLTEEELQELTLKARQLISQRVSHYAGLLDVSYGRITVRRQRSRWGSCSSSGNLSFNCLLMLAPAQVLDYVIVHELCHRKEMNHSSRFWAEVERLCPDYPLHRQWLREHGDALMARLP